ncbi:MAG: response regulator [Eubacterium sp.]|nr:response regulator [Eubacterium sp.]
MHILIADDEELTRKGLISSIDWTALGINKLDSADDGIHALACAKASMPDILLTDVRMPRMNGIDLAKRLREMSPDCPIIFMSGYSDKEYLKAAIHLKAVSYVEKPFDIAELTNALTEAVSSVRKHQLQAESNLFFLRETHSKLALALTLPGVTHAPDSASEEIFHHLSQNQFFTTMIIRADQQFFRMSDELLHEFFTRLNQCLQSYHMEELHTMKHAEYMILHLYSAKKADARTLQLICQQIRDILLTYYKENFQIVLGDTVKGMEQVYESYNNAVLLLQSSFFAPEQNIYTPYETGTQVTSAYLSQLPEQFAQLLSEKNPSTAQDFCDALSVSLHGNRNLLPNQARDLYYKLFLALLDAQHEAKISSFGEISLQSPLEQINNCTNYEQLHTLFTAAVNQYFDLLKTQQTDSSTLFLIKDYISTNYSDDNLSIKAISEHVHLSSSYLCTVFKTETGQTLNQYLTNFRIEKAKQLLADPRNKVNEVAIQVGYSDCNYFGKTFKKVVGLSPSEYREKELS